MGLDERRRVRRERLLDAGIALIGAPDGSAANVRAVCRAAELTERYFYESFTDRDAFVRAVYGLVGDRARDVLVAAVSSAAHARRAEAAVRAFVALMVDEPAMGRVLLLAPLREPAISGRGVELAPVFVALVSAQLTEIGDDAVRNMVAVGLVGALTSLFMGYLEGAIAVPRETFVHHCVALLERAAHDAQRRS
ncbi:MAG TPA: TetR/AcrR family transcriptional regulator [Rhodococcus sp. (in: high G+C Gram-positive bacteria)]|uniref:TetR/AcrR family transcriptional regulator n=1 Tax=Rhodococcus sp. SJ-3 TaxID=3454628 RepID=UPI002D9C3E58|nr:TetR/AcrR family transcriptional regulator [Rhodococcus sp. (in: high G+C Gram-positive bacteria)]